MQFRVLGPLEVLDDSGSPVDLGTPQRRALLVRLILSSNEVVSIDRLAEDLWEGLPPPGADVAIRVHISHIRRALGSARIRRLGRAYGLVVAESEVDAARFQAQVERAQQLLAEGAARRARDLVDESLAMWRGTALSDVADLVFAQADRVRLEEARLSALETSIEAGLALGHHDRLTGRLEALVNQHPLRERLWAQWMLALYRSGRQADALRAFQTLRRRLADELGIPPGPGLVKLEAAILQQDPELTWRAVNRGTAPPTDGLLTFCLTDIEGSTSLLQGLGQDRYTDLLDEHRLILRSAWSDHGGIEMSIQGDGTLVVFEDPSEAVRACVRAQLDLNRHEWPDGVEVRVRMGLHSGHVRTSSSGDYVGMALHQAERITRAAHGGQVLVSADTVAQMTLPTTDDFALTPLGRYRLRSFSEPVEIYAVEHPEIPGDFPPPSADALRRTNLPGETTSLFGRSVETTDVARLLKTKRLVTLLGPGGVGKTRLAVRTGRRVLDAFPDGVWLVELGPVSDPSQLADVVAEAGGLQLDPGRPGVDSLCAALSTRRTLVILDNCEHLVTACAGLTEELLVRTQQVRVLATSRERLSLRQEEIFPVGPLDVPSVAAGPGALESAPSVQLFIDRASSISPAFRAGEGDLVAIAEVCHQLDGLPLAIELAAARVNVLKPAEMVSRLRGQLDILESNGRRKGRNHSIRATLDWSYDLLEEPERLLLARLSVFVGSWDIESAEQVCGFGSLGPSSVLQALAGLVDKSLVTVDSGGAGGTRYRMLDLVRTYACEHARATGEWGVLGTRHAAWCLDRVGRSRARPGSDEESLVFDQFEADHANLLAALDELRSGHDSDYVRLALQLAPFWLVRGHLRLGHRQLRTALDRDSVPADLRAETLGMVGVLADAMGRPAEAQAALSESIALAEHSRDAVSLARWTCALGTALRHTADNERSWRCLEKARELARANQDRHTEVTSAVELGVLATQLDRLDEARTLLDDGLALARSVGDRRNEALALGTLGTLALATGDHDGAARKYEQALSICRAVGDRKGQCVWFRRSAELAFLHGELDRATDLYEEALALAGGIGDRAAEGDLIGDLGTVARYRGQYAEARARYEDALAIARQVGDRTAESLRLGGLASLAVRQHRYAEARRRFEEGLEIAQAVGDRSGEALRLSGLGTVALRLGQCGVARSLFESARRIADELGSDQFASTWLGNVGQVSLLEGRFGDARAELETARSAARQYGDRYNEGAWTGNLGNLAAHQGHYEEAAEAYRAALLVAEELGDAFTSALWKLGSGVALAGLRRSTEAAPLFEEALAQAVAIGDPLLQAEVRSEMAVMLSASQPRRALSLIGSAIRGSRQLGSLPLSLAVLSRLVAVLGEIHGSRSDPIPVDAGLLAAWVERAASDAGLSMSMRDRSRLHPALSPVGPSGQNPLHEEELVDADEALVRAAQLCSLVGAPL